MQFKRYEAWTKGLNLIVWLCCLIVVALGVRIAIIQGDFTFFLISIAVSCLSSLWVFVSARLAARAVDKGSLKDYLIVNEKEIMLFSKSETTCIYWEDATSYKVIKPYRGLQTTIICDSKGNKISFGSSDRLDKKIISFYPEIQSRMTVFSSMKMAEDYGTGDGSPSHEENSK